MSQEKDLYFVAVKVFLEDAEGRFLITKDRFGDWDLPGGRLRQEDFQTPLEDVVQRKIREELGDIAYQLEKPTVFMRHEREEILESGTKEKRRIFAVGYRANYLGGEVSLGKNHVEFQWVTKDFRAEDYFTGGWLLGVKEYLALGAK